MSHKAVPNSVSVSHKAVPTSVSMSHKAVPTYASMSHKAVTISVSMSHLTVLPLLICHTMLYLPLSVCQTRLYLSLSVCHTRLYLPVSVWPKMLYLPVTARWPFILRPTDGDTSSTVLSFRCSMGDGKRRGGWSVLVLGSWSLRTVDAASTILSMEDERGSWLWLTSRLEYNRRRYKLGHHRR